MNDKRCDSKPKDDGEISVVDMKSHLFGNLASNCSSCQENIEYVSLEKLDEKLNDTEVWIQGRIHEIRVTSKSLCFLIIRQGLYTLQVVVFGKKEQGKNFVKFVSSLTYETLVNINGTVTIPKDEINTTTQKVELQAIRVFSVSKPSIELPFLIKDANNCENDENVIHVAQDTRLDNRILDLRTFAMQGIVRVFSMTGQLFREFFYKNNFIEIHSPKIIGGSSEGGSNVFKLKYFGKDACLAQSPQLHKQMCILGDLRKVFEIGPVFRAENSNTHRHLCEFTGVDCEIAFKNSYFEVLAEIEKMFIYVFENLPKRCEEEIKAISKQYNVVPLRFYADKDKNKIIKLDFSEGVQLLRDNGVKDIPDDISEFDISTEQEKLLGSIIAEKYQTDFYYMINYPRKVRPFYTMPNPLNETLSNSYDFFLRGEEILSGAQRIHDYDQLVESIKFYGLDPDTLKSYTAGFRLGAPPHAGCGIGLERVVMLYLGLGNIRKISLFPRDPKRLEP